MCRGPHRAYGLKRAPRRIAGKSAEPTKGGRSPSRSLQSDEEQSREEHLACHSSDPVTTGLFPDSQPTAAINSYHTDMAQVALDIKKGADPLGGSTPPIGIPEAKGGIDSGIAKWLTSWVLFQGPVR